MQEKILQISRLILFIGIYYIHCKQVLLGVELCMHEFIATITKRAHMEQTRYNKNIKQLY